MNFENLSDEELISLYPKLLDELKSRNIIRTNNLIGDLGERLAIDFYKNTTGLPNLLDADPGTKHIDAISVNGERYAIKSTSTNLTGNFSSLSLDDNEKKFEFLIIVLFDKNYNLTNIYEITWDDFVEFRSIKKPENKWVISVTNKFKERAKKIK